MDRTIEKKYYEKIFFKTFEFGGTLHVCFRWMQEKYDLVPKLSKEDENKPKKVLSKKLRHYYDVELPKEIKEETEGMPFAYDYTVIPINRDSPLMDEIADNLDECNSEQKDRYIYSLLRPFKMYSDVFNPISEIRRLNRGLKELEEDLERLGNEQLTNIIYGEPAATPKEQAKNCKELIEACKYRIERTKFVANKYRELIGTSSSKRGRFNVRAKWELWVSEGSTERWLQKGTVENSMRVLYDNIYIFACRLDALLLERGINLLWYQNECDIYLYEDRDICAIADCLGSYKIAQKYIDKALPKYPVHEQDNNTETAANKITLPSELNTEPAKALFQGAIQNGLCDNDYQWLKSKALLAYFADKASEYLNLGKGEYVHSSGKAKATLKKTSWKPFETLFGVKGLSGGKNDYSNKIEKLPDGYEDVDNLFK